VIGGGGGEDAADDLIGRDLAAPWRTSRVPGGFFYTRHIT
jgi:hypothetical protein